jgi:hypothetical protein
LLRLIAKGCFPPCLKTHTAAFQTQAPFLPSRKILFYQADTEWPPECTFFFAREVSRGGENGDQRTRNTQSAALGRLLDRCADALIAGPGGKLRQGNYGSNPRLPAKENFHRTLDRKPASIFSATRTLVIKAGSSAKTDKEVLLMLAKCANPSCSTELVYLREGKIFMVEAPAQAQKSEPSPKPLNRVEHFWLCGPCAAQLTLAYDRRSGVQIVPKKLRVLAAAS